jgi:hypothetical protein
MKSLFIIASILFAIVILFQSFMSRQTEQTEKQKYTVLYAEGDFEVRHYPSATVATMRSSARNYRDLSGTGFRKIAGYIFGDNVSQEKIAMTSPVHMSIGEKESSMSFVMPSGYDLSNLPRPNDPDVNLEKTPEEHVAAIRFGGYAGDETIRRNIERLETLLKQKGIRSMGNHRYLGYNPPYQVVGRRNEIIVTIDWKGASDAAVSAR